MQSRGKLRVLDLFSGIGGFSIGLERAGMQTVAFCEIEPFCRAVLKKHWPEVPCYDDIRTLTAKRLAEDGITANVICGGFPCQDISTAGKGAGIEGSRSGLWSEYARLIGEIRPRLVIVENVAALLGRGLSRVLGDLAALGYDAEWHCISAADIGAPHLRERIWIVAYPNSDSESDRPIDAETLQTSHLADTDSTQCKGSWLSSKIYEEYSNARCASWWEIEPNVGRVANGVPAGSHRLKSLGNSVVPQIPEIIGKAIIASLGE